MVRAEHRALHLEEVGRVAHVAHQVGGHVRDRLERRRIDLLPRLQHRVGVVPRVEGHFARVGVDGRLDRVADVVDVVERDTRRRVRRVADRVAEAHDRRVGVVRAQGVAVDDPHDLAVDDRRIRIVVELEVRRDLLHPGHRIAVVEDLRLVVDRVGEQDVGRLELQRVDQAVEEVADLGAAVARERRLRLRCPVGTARIVELDVRATLGSADDRVRRRGLAEVDARLVGGLIRERARGRDAPLQEHGVAVGRAVVALRGDHSVAVRIDERRVVPGRRCPELVEVELADRDHGILAFPVDLVAVDIERVGELVVRTVLLELADRRRNDGRVHDADGCRRVGVLAQLPRLGVGRCLEVALLEAVDAVGGLRRVDVALVEGAFQGLLVGHDLELVHEERVGDRDDQGRHDEQGRSDEGEAPASDHRGDEEQHGDDRGGDREDGEPRDDGVHVDVARTRDAVTRLGERLVPVEPQARALDEQVEARDNRELDACRLRDAQLALADPHRAVEVGDEHRHAEADEEHRGGEAEHGGEERHREQVEPDVHLELRVGGSRVDPIGPQPHRLPLRGGGEAGEEPEKDRDAPHREAAERLDDLLVVVQLRTEPRVDGSEPVGELDRDEHGDGHREEAHDEHDDPRRPLGPQHAGEAQLVEPQPVGVEAREEEEADDDHGDHDERDGDGLADGIRRGLVRRGGRGHPTILGAAPPPGSCACTARCRLGHIPSRT